MKKLLFLLVFLNCHGLLGCEDEVLRLLKRQDDQRLGLLTVMTSIGLYELIKNSDQICSAENPYCWKVIAPLASFPIMAGYFLYREWVFKQGKK